MAIQQIQKTSSFKPDMIGDLVEVTAYDTSSGELHTITGILAAYSTDSDGVEFKIDGIDKGNFIPASGYNISITHHEFVLNLTDGGDDE